MKRMHKFGVGMICIIAITGAVFIWKWPVITFGLQGGGNYSESDNQVYDAFTPDVIKKMPRISSHYQFQYHTVAGTSGNQLTFYNTADVSRIDDYLSSMGYIQQSECMVQGNCWKGSDPTEVIVVSTDNHSVLIQVDYTPVSG